MKKNLHPAFVDCQVICACGNKFMTKATIPEIKTELCSKCHPFFTGEQVLIDTAGQVDRFQKRIAISEQRKATTKKKVKVAAPKVESKVEETTEDLLKKIKIQMEDDAQKKAAKTAKKPAVKKK
ncbi:50S ribosomal protein L31 [Candidatus Wirthbacteria bacterium CG2_30_54_11]|uniref:Large ribosomal subunit protein bL31 n=1 Tax=Candidatus Wirthbacteria bacterium CG2_30_54_11 TaxID=1817892 RepID=A0A1J5IKA4_9BACT|nr:MAG: 50S ribosomal protein L31 [Candidatus Wirthbacteria bacterium CG2_30_54_11]